MSSKTKDSNSEAAQEQNQEESPQTGNSQRKKLRHSKAMWFTFVLDAVALFLFAVEPHLHMLKDELSSLTYIIVLGAVSVVVKTLRFIQYKTTAKDRLSRLFARWTGTDTRSNDADS